jgi:hypothetical protein
MSYVETNAVSNRSSFAVADGDRFDIAHLKLFAALGRDFKQCQQKRQARREALRNGEF